MLNSFDTNLANFLTCAERADRLLRKAINYQADNSAAKIERDRAIFQERWNHNKKVS